MDIGEVHHGVTLTLSLPPPHTPKGSQHSQFELEEEEEGHGDTVQTHDLARPHEPRTRFFSFSAAGSQYKPNSVRRPNYLRQNTVSGGGVDASVKEIPQIFTRALSRTFTLASTASSSLPMEEWRPIFDKLDLESDGKLDGTVPVEKFKAILEDDPVWVESVPLELQEKILNSVDKNKDGLIDYEEFMDLVKGKSIGFSKLKRRALRELIKQTVEFIVPYKYSYQNQYSCSPPPLFMLAISLLQITVFTYNSIVLNEEVGYVGLNGPVPYCSSLIYNPEKRHQIWRYWTYMLIHSGIFHAAFNILIQLILGIPLEMVHGTDCFFGRFSFVRFNCSQAGGGFSLSTWPESWPDRYGLVSLDPPCFYPGPVAGSTPSSLPTWAL